MRRVAPPGGGAPPSEGEAGTSWATAATGTPLVAIVGRPNVGKSALFNRLVRGRVAIVEDEPGTTRDRLYGDLEWRGRRLRLVDTGGLEIEGHLPLSQQVRGQVESAVREADVLLFVVDARDGPTAPDHDVADALRRAAKPVLLVANKAESEPRRQASVEFYELGFGEPLPVSAHHGTGIDELLDLVASSLPPIPADEGVAAEALRVAIIGRPNVGKSLLLNAILGEERVIVSEEPGTTRDSIDTPFQYSGRQLVLVDTAGIRRPGKVQRGVEQHAVLRAERALERAEVALLVMDASQGVTAQDTHVAGRAQQARCGLVLVANKWDLVPGGAEVRTHSEALVHARFRFAAWAPLCFVSAKERTGLPAMLDAALAAGVERRRRIPAHELNSRVARLLAQHPPPLVKGRRLKVLYVTQAEPAPPTFVFFANDASLVHFSYRRYLENGLRRAYGFQGTPIRLVFRSRGE